MAHVSYRPVRIGGKTIELKGATGTVVDLTTSTHTETIIDRDRNSVSSTVTAFNSFGLRTSDGEEYSATVRSDQASVRHGDTVTGFWGDVGSNEGGWLAFYNHDLGTLRYVARERNDLAGPLPYNWLLLFGVIGIVAGAGRLMVGAGGTGSLMLLITSIAIWVWILRRRKALTRAVEAAVASVKREPSLA